MLFPSRPRVTREGRRWRGRRGTSSPLRPVSEAEDEDEAEAGLDAAKRAPVKCAQALFKANAV
jgi:hypothetical protein